MILFPFGKINIGLSVKTKRPDGYHEIETLMAPVSGLTDILEIVPWDGRAYPGMEHDFPTVAGREGQSAVFTSSGIPVDGPAGENLCLRAYEAMAEEFPKVGSVRMHLHKIIPMGAGLGGGSSDAAFAIKGLDRVFGLGLGPEEMERIAAGLGSDVPYFIKGTAQLATGRGEILSPADVPALAGKRIVVVAPGLKISTAEAYAGITPRQPERPLAELLGGEIGGWREAVSNDFERHIFERYPLLSQIKEELYAAGALYASMSGSGSALYAIFGAETAVRPERFAGSFVHQQVMA